MPRGARLVSALALLGCVLIVGGYAVVVQAQQPTQSESVPAEVNLMPLTGKTVAILAADEYEDLELLYPALRFQEAGANVMVVGRPGCPDEVKSKHGYAFPVTHRANEVSPAQVDVVICPGGWAPDELRRDETILALVRGVWEKGGIVASICHGAWVPISAKIVKGRTMTAYRPVKDDIENAGATFVNQEVVVDGNLITSRWPEDLPAFCRAIISKMLGQASP